MPFEIIFAVFDCNVYIQALLNPNSIAAECFDVVRNGKVKLFVSEGTLAEISDVVSRPNILARLPNFNVKQIEAFIENVLDVSTLVRSVPKSFTLERDPKDEIIIDLAVEVKADYIVSRDKDLLDLTVGFTANCKEFRQRFRFLTVVEPLEFLRIAAG